METYICRAHHSWVIGNLQRPCITSCPQLYESASVENKRMTKGIELMAQNPKRKISTYCSAIYILQVLKNTLKPEFKKERTAIS